MAGRLTEEQCSELMDEILEALDDLVERSGCSDMSPLWFLATARARREFLPSEGTIDAVPTHIQSWRAPQRSRYGQLAVFRHAVLWKPLLDRLPEAQRQAMEDMYFTPFPSNETPYAWTKKSSEAPGIGQYESPTAFDELAREACRALYALIGQLVEQGRCGTLLQEAESALMEPATRRTLSSVLRIEE